MAFLLASPVLLGLLASTVNAQDGPVNLCTGNDCGYCPNSITTTGTGYPSCVIYDRDTTLGGYADDYEDIGSSQRMIYYDIAEVSNPECRTIIRTPASTTDPNCGVPIYGGSGGVCYAGPGTKETFMIQFCCGTGDCSSAGVGKRDGSVTMTSAVLHDSLGNLIQPHSVGDNAVDKMDIFLADHGLNSSSSRKSFTPDGIPIFRIGYQNEKRDCDSYTPNGGPYTKTGSESYIVSGYICDSTTKVTITNENSIARTTTFGSSVSDPFGIVSASIEFSTEEEASQSYSYEFTPQDGQCGHVAFTPFFTCTGGTITGCDGGDQTGEVCTAKRIDNNQVDGAYLFVQTG